MKKIIKFFIVLFTIGFLNSCNDMKVGFLDTRFASYLPNNMTVKRELNPKLYEDQDRMMYKSNWISASIQGVQGTPIKYFSIHEVKATEGGNVEAFLKYTNLRGNGQFDVQFENQIPLGKYVISIKIENESHINILEDIYTINFIQK